MAANPSSLIPQPNQLLLPTFLALKKLGGSGSNDEILDAVIEALHLPDEAVDFPHLGSTTKTELEYRLAWARTYLRMSGVIENSARSIWSILPTYSNKTTLSESELAEIKRRNSLPKTNSRRPSSQLSLTSEQDAISPESEYPSEIKSWQEKLSQVLHNMNPYGFERLTQRLLRECGFG